MFDSMLESTTAKPGDRSRWALPIAFGAHIVIIGLIVGVSYLIVQAVQDPDVPWNRISSGIPLMPEPKTILSGAPFACTAVDGTVTSVMFSTVPEGCAPTPPSSPAEPS